MDDVDDDDEDLAPEVEEVHSPPDKKLPFVIRH